jgi:hypothetical protein
MSQRQRIVMHFPEDDHDQLEILVAPASVPRIEEKVIITESMTGTDGPCPGRWYVDDVWWAYESNGPTTYEPIAHVELSFDRRSPQC